MVRLYGVYYVNVAITLLLPFVICTFWTAVLLATSGALLHMHRWRQGNKILAHKLTQERASVWDQVTTMCDSGPASYAQTLADQLAVEGLDQQGIAVAQGLESNRERSVGQRY